MPQKKVMSHTETFCVPSFSTNQFYCSVSHEALIALPWSTGKTHLRGYLFVLDSYITIPKQLQLCNFLPTWCANTYVTLCKSGC